MRAFTVSILVLSLTGCVHEIGSGNHQNCAFQGMVLDGVDLGSASATTTGPKFRTYQTNAYSESARCSRPKTDEEKCQISAYQRSWQPAADFNKNVGLDNFAVGLGYCLFILPGAAAYLYFDSKRDESYRDMIGTIQGGLKSCEREAQAAH